MTLEQFRLLPNFEKPYWDFWRSELIWQPYNTHWFALLSAVLIGAFGEDLMPLPRLTLRLGGDAELIPNLVLLSKMPDGDYPTGDVLLTIDSLYPGQTLEWHSERCRFECGAPHSRAN